MQEIMGFPACWLLNGWHSEINQGGGESSGKPQDLSGWDLSQLRVLASPVLGALENFCLPAA